MTQKNLIIFIPSIEGYGVEKNLFIIANFLSKKFDKIVLISTSKKYKNRFNKNINFITPLSNFWEKGGRFKKNFVCSLLLAKHLFNNKKSLVFSFQANLYSTTISKILGAKIIIRLNSAPVEWSRNSLKKKIFQYVFSIADRVIVNSLEFKKVIKKKFNVDSICIYNPLNKNEVLLKAKIKTKNIYKNKNSLKIINIGRLVDQKNQIILLKAIKFLIEKEKIALELVVVGDGDLKQSLLNFVLKNKLQKIIKIKNFNANPFNLIKQSDIFVLTSKYEGLPNVLLEAITLNKFVISSDCPTGPKEILLNGNAGLLCKTSDHIDLANKILFYLNNKKKCKKMLFLAQKNLKRFDYDKNLNTYLKVINNLK